MVFRVRRPVLSLLAGAAILLTVLAGADAGASAAPPAKTATGYVARSGTELTVNGKPWKFAGYNLPCANAFDLDPAALGYYLDYIHNNGAATVIRVWFFQSFGGPDNWTPFDQIISALKARGMRAIVTLTNQWNTCDEPSPATAQKDLSWYQGGYQQPEGGYPLSFQAYATAVAAHYANEPTIAFWQLVNEAQAPTIGPSGQVSCDEGDAALALRSFGDAMVTSIQSVDSHHLVDLGTSGAGCGTGTVADDEYVHDGKVSLCDYHDYGQSAVPMPAAWATSIADCHADGKPAFVGESGILANVQPDGTPNSECSPWPGCSPDEITNGTLAQRGAFFKAKIAAGDQQGVAGYVVWVDSPYYTPSTEGYDIGDDPSQPDPTGSALPAALDAYPHGSHAASGSSAANAPASSVPEAPWAALLIASGVVVGGAALAFARARARRRAGVAP
jgi:hypothetical protein